MCGICGFVPYTSTQNHAQDRLASMCQTIYHRGPDDQGLYLGGKAALGVRRLSIIDVEGGHQPLGNEDGSIWIAHNGEVYNFPELRKELLNRGHFFKTRTDTETILHAYEEWGLEFHQKLRGMFATAIWDEPQNRLILIRDRLGIKPLYYTCLEDKTLVFGSELKALLAYPGVPRRLAAPALDLFLTLEYIPAPYSIFQNVFKLPAGCMLIFENGSMQIQKYWELRSPEAYAETSPKRHLDTMMDELYELLKESVKLRLISDVPLGAFLSGGIDSSCIVGLMRELGASPLKTFSIGFEDTTYNELAHAQRIAQTFQTDHEEFILQPKALDLTEKLVRHLDEPFGDFSIFPTYLVSQMAHNHVKVILSGDGGDEVFAGYEHYQAQKISEWSWLNPLYKGLSPIVRRFPPSPKKKGLWNKLQRYCQGLDHPVAARHFRWMMFLSQKQKETLYTDDLVNALNGIPSLPEQEPFRQIFAHMPAYDDITSELYLDLNTYLVDDILVKVDRMSMATSLETRVPIIDHKIVEYIFNLPGRFKLNGLTTKWIFKKTMERLLPKENIYRSKEGFSIPIKHWLKTELKELMLTCLSKERIESAGYFQYPTIQNMIHLHLNDKANFSHQLWALLVFEIWREHYS